MDLPGLTIRPLAAADLEWADRFLDHALGGRIQARRGELIDVLDGGPGSGSIAIVDGQPVGLITWLVDRTNGEAEIRAVAVADDAHGQGVGRALLLAAEDALRSVGIRRAWLVTTNDNLAALALYQKAGWRLLVLRPGAIDEARRTIKPSIPEVGEHGIPLRDELELARSL